MMGRKARKTRWRTLNIDEQSDSEESNIAGGEKSYHNGQKSVYSRFTFSSQSTPTRTRYNHDIKSTRSSSTASETKVTFNEDEYTRITTPRQDVLFKKGYLNKPKTYQTQTSTGTSTNSTGNSTGNGTPDHQSADGTEGTDLEYESQFVFPNGFVDQNGIYYINSYEPYPLVVYNAPVCYPDFNRPKRYSTGSLTESASPNNEENSQSGGEANGIQDFNPQVYNVIYHHQGYYYGNNTINGTNSNNGEINGEAEPRKVKKKRRRKQSKSRDNDDDDDTDTVSEYTGDEEEEKPKENGEERLINEESTPPPSSENKIPLNSVHEQNGCDESKCDENNVHCDKKNEEEEETTATTPVPNHQKFDLKPDAEEFIPKAYREPIVDPNIQFVNFPPPNFVPIPIMSDIPPAPFLAPGIPINFVPPPPPPLPNAKLIPNYVNFVPNFVPKTYPTPPTQEETKTKQEEVVEERLNVENKQHFVTPTDASSSSGMKMQKIPNKTDIDIERIVSKLEEAAKEQRLNENKRQNFGKYNKNRYHQNYQQKKRKENEERFPKPRNGYYKPENTETTISTVKKAQNYSAMLKRCPRLEKPQETSSPPPTSSPKAVNKKPATQWISVASRKKRKNKTEETDGVFEETVPEKVETENDGFESYNVNELVDVVIPKEEEEEEVKVEEKVIDIPIEEKAPPEDPVPVDEEEIVVKLEEEKPIVLEQEDVKIPKKPKKKQPQTKRIIIKDTYEVTPEVVEPKKPEEPPPQEPLTAVESPVSTPEKRTKRKKKKPAQKLVKSVSISSSSTTLNNFDDSYDFLLEPSVLDESEDKTNVEISQELDRLIQKGMYSNLEEKIKSLNTPFANDNFFNSVNLISSSQSNNFLKTNEFGPLFKTSLMKPKRYDNEDLTKLNIDFTKIKLTATPEPQPSTSKTGIFLENPEVNEILKDTGNEIQKLEEEPVVPLTKSKSSNGKLKNKSKKSIDENITKDEKQNTEVEQKKTSNEPEDKPKLYPITQAVKEWMTKTRENAPEVELLKSPNTIKKELSENEEVVLFSTEGLVESDEMTNGFEEPKPTEETIEIYESKYGKNEDYLKIQAEIEENTKNKLNNFPKHGNLPYRAICCSIM